MQSFHALPTLVHKLHQQACETPTSESWIDHCLYILHHYRVSSMALTVQLGTIVQYECYGSECNLSIGCVCSIVTKYVFHSALCVNQEATCTFTHSLTFEVLPVHLLQYLELSNVQKCLCNTFPGGKRFVTQPVLQRFPPVLGDIGTPLPNHTLCKAGDTQPAMQGPPLHVRYFFQSRQEVSECEGGV